MGKPPDRYTHKVLNHATAFDGGKAHVCTVLVHWCQSGGAFHWKGFLALFPDSCWDHPCASMSRKRVCMWVCMGVVPSVHGLSCMPMSVAISSQVCHAGAPNCRFRIARVAALIQRWAQLHGKWRDIEGASSRKRGRPRSSGSHLQAEACLRVALRIALAVDGGPEKAVRFLMN